MSAGAWEAEGGRQPVEIQQPLLHLRVPFFTVDEDGAHSQRARSLDVLLEGIADHYSLLGACTEALEQAQHLVLDRREPVGARPEPGQQADEDVERCLRSRRREERARLAALEQQGAANVVAGEQPDGALPVPALQRIGLLARLAVGPVHLEYRGRPVRQLRADYMTADAGDTRVAETQAPIFRDLVGE